MKVLFAVNNDEISDAIFKKYQKEYREILSYKNVYYFNAILKELQKDKSYDRVVISEDLEPFANNNYDTIDKWLFDKLNNISDEATKEQSNNTEIILICTDRRSKSDDMLVKLFDIGVYNAIIGQDRSIDEVCKLINKPRLKNDAKLYYKIEAENKNYQLENEDNVSEVEVQNILAHYKRLGKNEEKYVDSFNNIVSQYTDNQLKIIIRYLPIGVKAVLEEKSPKYQELVEYTGKQEINYNQYNLKHKEETNKKAINIKNIENEFKNTHTTKPIIIPSGVNTSNVKKLIKQEKPKVGEHIIQKNEYNELEINETEEIEETQKRGRGRPRKNSVVEEEITDSKPKRGRGRPRKNPVVEEVEEIDLFNFNEIERNNDEEEIDLFNLNETEKNNNEEEIDLFNLNETEKNNNEENEEEMDLFDFEEKYDDKKDKEDINFINVEEFKDYNDEKKQDNTNLFNNNINDTNDVKQIAETQYKPAKIDFNTLITKDKKIVSFVGTTKNGTSFVVNNVAHLLASRGISTAILDMTKTRNAYYIYTNSEEQLMETARKCIYKLRSGINEGIRVNKNLDVYTLVPEDDTDYSDIDSILGTLIKKYSVVLIDCDFDTPTDWFVAAQEIYLVQSMDVLTIQPLTAFLRNLQSKGVLKQEKIKIVINKGVNIKSVPIKTLIGGISKYNDPSMTYMKELFDKDKINYCVIPFELPNYIKYLDSLITCSISLNGYTKAFINSLNELGNMIYPLISKPAYSPRGNKYKESFSSEMNNTLNKMKRKYQ